VDSQTHRRSSRGAATRRYVVLASLALAAALLPAGSAEARGLTVAVADDSAAQALDRGALRVELRATRRDTFRIDALAWQAGSRRVAIGRTRTTLAPGRARRLGLPLRSTARSLLAACGETHVLVRVRSARGRLAGSTSAVLSRSCDETWTAARKKPRDPAPEPDPTPVPTEPAPAPAPATGLLSWAPPALQSPTTIRLGTGYTVTDLDPTRDYVIQLPSERKVGATVIKGGHNVVIKGGWITIPTLTASDAERRGIYIKDATGTVHIEGVLIDGSGGGNGDGIAISAPNAVVQVENSRIVGLRGSYAGYHADVIQPWGGVSELRVDRLTGSTNYQGLQIPRDLGPIGRADLRNVDLSHTGEAPAEGGYLLWLTKGTSTCEAYPVSISDVYIAPKSGRWLADSVWPGVWSTLPCKASQVGAGADAQVSWPTLPVTGFVRRGPRPEGEFVPSGVAGVGYVSPGYR
jgi:hypothetical protein